MNNGCSNRRNHLTMATTTAIALASFFLHAPARAQQTAGPNPAPGGAEGTSDALVEIVVTAQRRSEKLQDTPITVSAITGDVALEKGVTETSDLQIVTPGLVYADSGIGAALYLRGVGTENTGFGDEGSIATYIDGVVVSSLPGAFASLANIDRVEVLKGPQGTLFGRNATGGLINIITKDPSFTESVEMSANAGTYQTYGGQIYATAPITNTVAMNFSGYYNNQIEGFGRNLTTGQDVYNGHEDAFRSKILFQPSDDTKFVLSGDYAQRKVFDSSGSLDYGAVGIIGDHGLANPYDTQSSLQPLQNNSQGGASLHAEQGFSFARLISITAWRFDTLNDQFDNDRGPAAIADVYFTNRDTQFTQELQLQSRPESPVSWIVGAYYLNATTDMQHFTIDGAAVASVGGSIDQPAEQGTRSRAGYGQFTVPLGDRTNFTGGVRYTDDKRNLSSSTVLLALGGVVIPNPVGVETSDYNKVTFRAALDHHFTDDIMTFVSFNRGFKSGIFDLLTVTNPPVKPEVLDAYEIGEKSEFFDHRMRLNASAFLYKYNNIQLSEAGAIAETLVNAAKATVKGIDVDSSFLVTHGLLVDASAEFLHNRYDSFPNAPYTVPSPGTCGPPPAELPGPRTGGTINCAIDAEGLPMIRSPDFSFTVGARYEWPTAIGKFQAGGNYFHSTSFAYEAGQRLQQPAYGVFNAQVGWRATSDRLGVRLYGRNITDARYYTNRISSLVDSHEEAAPATGGIAVDIKF